MANPGWNLPNGDMLVEHPLEDELWTVFNFVFSENCAKRSTYKFALIKAILDNLFNSQKDSALLFISYEDLFAKFAESYWNLVVKYGLHQMRATTESTYSKIEQFFQAEIELHPIESQIEFSSLPIETKNNLIKKISVECRKNVIGALYQNLQGMVYSFDLKGSGLFFNAYAFNFMMKYKLEIEKLNYYSWAKFLEQVNDDPIVTRIIDKLELSIPQRDDLSVFRNILKKEFEDNTCFYCGKKLTNNIHVDHFIPWSFIKEDKLWNFVLTCPTCNISKSNRVPTQQYLDSLIRRNEVIKVSKDRFIQNQFALYNDKLLKDIWLYAQHGGIQLFSPSQNQIAK